ncbi:hypothetical protein GCM10020331_080180 [Ectobacillus funiculus]
MIMTQDWLTYLQQLYNAIQLQQQQLQRLEETVERLTAELEKFQTESSPVHRQDRI